VYNRTIKKGNPMINFDNVINEDAIAKLTDEQATALLAILEKAGY
jgi:regulator of RNase E activity RraB